MNSPDSETIIRFTNGFSLFKRAYWWWCGGPVISVKWPSGTIVAGPGPSDPLWYDLGGAAYIKFESADPNDHYRPWLEKNVGKQGKDWEWAVGSILGNTVNILFSKRKAKWATFAAIKWS